MKIFCNKFFNVMMIVLMTTFCMNLSAAYDGTYLRALNTSTGEEYDNHKFSDPLEGIVSVDATHKIAITDEEFIQEIINNNHEFERGWSYRYSNIDCDSDDIKGVIQYGKSIILVETDDAAFVINPKTGDKLEELALDRGAVVQNFPKEHLLFIGMDCKELILDTDDGEILGDGSSPENAGPLKYVILGKNENQLIKVYQKTVILSNVNDNGNIVKQILFDKTSLFPVNFDTRVITHYNTDSDILTVITDKSAININISDMKVVKSKDWEDGTRIGTFVKFTADGKSLISANDNKLLKVDISSFEQAWSLDITSPATMVALSLDGKNIFVVFDDCFWKVDINSGEEELQSPSFKNFDKDDDFDTQSLTQLPDGNIIYNKYVDDRNRIYFMQNSGADLLMSDDTTIEKTPSYAKGRKVIYYKDNKVKVDLQKLGGGGMEKHLVSVKPGDPDDDDIDNAISISRTDKDGNARLYVAAKNKRGWVAHRTNKWYLFCYSTSNANEDEEYKPLWSKEIDNSVVGLSLSKDGSQLYVMTNYNWENFEANFTLAEFIITVAATVASLGSAAYSCYISTLASTETGTALTSETAVNVVSTTEGEGGSIVAKNTESVINENFAIENGIIDRMMQRSRFELDREYYVNQLNNWRNFYKR